MTKISDDRLRKLAKLTGDKFQEEASMARELLAIRTAAAEPAAFIVERPLASGGTHLYLPFLRAGDEADRWRKANPDEKLVALYTSPPPSGEAREVTEFIAAAKLLEDAGWKITRPDPFTYGHCENKKAPGGCQLHNLHCGFPDCDRRALPTIKEPTDGK